MNDTTAVARIAGKDYTLRPLTLGGMKRERDAMVLLNGMQSTTATGQRSAVPTADEMDAMVRVVAEAAGLGKPAAAEERRAFIAAVEELEWAHAMGELSDAIVKLMRLTGLKRSESGAGDAAAGEAQGS